MADHVFRADQLKSGDIIAYPVAQLTHLAIKLERFADDD